MARLAKMLTKCWFTSSTSKIIAHPRNLPKRIELQQQFTLGFYSRALIYWCEWINLLRKKNENNNNEAFFQTNCDLLCAFHKIYKSLKKKNHQKIPTLQTKFYLSECCWLWRHMMTIHNIVIRKSQKATEPNRTKKTTHSP